MLDKLPAQLRHFILIVGFAFIGVIAKAINDASGVTAVHWSATLTLALNTAVTSGVTGFMLLNLTPLTKQYGAFGVPSAPTPTGIPAELLATPPSGESQQQGIPS